jgi:hypothetical protein
LSACLVSLPCQPAFSACLVSLPCQPALSACLVSLPVLFVLVINALVLLKSNLSGLSLLLLDIYDLIFLLTDEFFERNKLVRLSLAKMFILA